MRPVAHKSWSTSPIIALLLVAAAALSGCAHFDPNTPRWTHFEKLASENAKINLYYEAYGRGDPILFIHGWGLNTNMWSHLVSPLAQHHRVILIDLKGFGESPKPADGNYSAYDQARLVSQFIRTRGLKDLTIVGHSFGGSVALITSLYLAEVAPDVQNILILIDSMSYEQPLPSFVRILATPALGRLVVSLIPKTVQVRSMMKLAYYDDVQITDGVVEQYAEPFREPGAEHATLTTARQLIPPDLGELSERYATIQLPTLLIWGREDKIVPLYIGQQLAFSLPHSELVVLDQCGHVPPEEKPMETVNAILRFLDKHH